MSNREIVTGLAAFSPAKAQQITLVRQDLGDKTQDMVKGEDYEVVYKSKPTASVEEIDIALKTERAKALDPECWVFKVAWFQFGGSWSIGTDHYTGDTIIRISNNGS